MYNTNMNNDFELKTFSENPDLNKYNQELKDDISLNKMNLREKSLMVGSIRVKWLNYYFKEKENLHRIQKAKEKILKQKMSSSKVSDSILQLKKEETIAGNDENIQKLNKLMENVKINIDFLEHSLNVLNDFGFNIKNSIDAFKLEGLR